MWVLDVGLVLDEIVGPRDLADVMVVRAHAREQRIGTDGLSGTLRHIADDDRMVIGSRGLGQQLAKERVSGAGQLEQLVGGGDAKETPSERIADKGQARRE